MFARGGKSGLCWHVLRGKWFMVFAASLIMSCSGTAYIFGVYSPSIKSSLLYNQRTLNTVSFFKDLGGNVGIASGLLAELLPPWALLLAASAMNLFGYLSLYLSITTSHSLSPPPPLWLVCFYISVAANSQTFTNTAAIVTCVKTFPSSRGTVLGLLKGFLGLSGAIFTQLYYALYGGKDPASLVLLIAWLPALISAVFATTIRPRKAQCRSSEFNVFCYFLYISVALAVYLMAVIVFEKIEHFSQLQYSFNAAVVVFLLFLPLAIVVREEISVLKQQKNSYSLQHLSDSESETEIEKQTIGRSPQSSKKKPSTPLFCVKDIFKPPKRGEDYSILQALVSVDMLIIFFSTICGFGGTMSAIDNMAQIGESLGYSPQTVGTFISLISIWNYTGRVCSGFISEILLSKYKFPRPLLLSLVLLLSCVGFLAIALGLPGSLYAASVIIGFSLGAQVPLFFAIISEIFGLKYFSTLYNLGGLASPLASYILNVRITGELYDREAMKQNGEKLNSSGGKGLTCIGVQCFQLSFLIITVITVAGAAALLVLAWRTKEFYGGDLYAKYKNGHGAGEVMEEEMSSLVDIKEMDGNAD